MKIIGKKGQEIKTLDDYREYAGPKERAQWKDEHSAKEFAKKVINGDFEKDMKVLFGENIIIDEVYPEKEVEFDEFRGGKRNHDLACIAQLNGEKIAICVEAKATENFGNNTTGDYYYDTKKNNKSNVTDRIEKICERLWDNKQLDEQIKNIEYQLLTAMAGTIDYEKQQEVTKRYFVVYQLETAKTTKDLIDSHKEAITNFLLKFGKKFENNKKIKLRSDKEWYLVYVQREKAK